MAHGQIMSMKEFRVVRSTNLSEECYVMAETADEAEELAIEVEQDWEHLWDRGDIVAEECDYLAKEVIV